MVTYVCFQKVGFVYKVPVVWEPEPLKIFVRSRRRIYTIRLRNFVNTKQETSYGIIFKTFGFIFLKVTLRINVYRRYPKGNF
jgi:hypothetical protein